MKGILAGLVLASSLAGCAVGPDRAVPPPEVPRTWSSPQAKVGGPRGSDLAKWWERFGDATLDGLVAHALRGGTDVRAATAKVREARALSDVAESALYPSLGATAGGTTSRTSAAGALAASNASLYSTGFDQSWELDLFGANHRAAEAAADAAASEYQGLRVAALATAADVVRAYVDARGYQARASLARRAAAAQRETVTLTERRVAAGASSGADLAKARAQALSTEANVPALEAGYATAVHRIGILTGDGPEALLARMAVPGPVPMPRASVAAGIPAEVVRSRPDVRQAEETYAQATALVGEAQARSYPDVTLGGTLGLGAGGLGSLLSGSAVAYSIGPSLTLPLLDAGGRRAAVTAQEAVRDQRLEALRAAVLTALGDVEDALTALAAQRTQTVRLAASEASYAEADRIARLLYAQGATTFLDVLDADRSLYGAQDAAMQGRVTLAEDHAALFKALGGGWEGEVRVSPPEVAHDARGPRPRSSTSAR